ncbi:MAG: TRAP transporter substrate-binding protein [Rhodobacteraceae bacterium]|nr:TRAP transporter substrate-binding protein [Paracoccaceae bacterium]
MDKAFADLVAERSGGRIKITIHYGGAIGFKSREHLDMVGSGAVELADTPIHFHGGTNPLLEIGSLPFITATADDAYRLYGMLQDDYVEVLGKLNQVPIAAAPWTPVGFWSNMPFTKPEDLHGWTVRVYDINGQITLKEAGANPVTMAWTEVVPALTTHAIDGVLTSADAGANAEMWQYLKHYTEVGYGWQWNLIHMNLDTWNSLPPDLQEIVRDAGREVTERAFTDIKDKLTQSYDKLRANGVTVVTELDPALREFLLKAAKPAEDRWLERMGPAGAEILDAYRAN